MIIDFLREIYVALTTEIETWGFLGWCGFVASALAIAQFLFVVFRKLLRWLDEIGLRLFIWGVRANWNLVHLHIVDLIKDLRLSYNLRSDPSLMAAYVGERLSLRMAMIAAGGVCYIALPQPFNALSSSFLIGTAALQSWSLFLFLSMQRNLRQRVDARIRKSEKILKRLDRAFSESAPVEVQKIGEDFRKQISNLRELVELFEVGPFRPASEGVSPSKEENSEQFFSQEEIIDVNSASRTKL